MTVRTRYFDVHYPAPMAEWTLDLVSRIDAVHDAVSAFVGYAPRARITVIVEDPVNQSNGFANPPLASPLIVLWPTPPDPSGMLGDVSRLAGAARRARVRAHRAPHAADAQPGGATLLAIPATHHRSRSTPGAAVGDGRVRDVRRRTPNGKRAPARGGARRLPAAMGARREAADVRAAFVRRRLRRRRDGVPRRLRVPRVARGAARGLEPRGRLAAHERASATDVRAGVRRGVRCAA